MFKKGDMILPIDRIKKQEWKNGTDGLYHPAVIWQEEYDGESDFLAIMLSSKGPERYSDNIQMMENHFEKGHKKGYNNSHFVNQLFDKIGKWGDFEKVGRLTEEGIEFIEDNLTNTDAISFIAYHKKRSE